MSKFISYFSDVLNLTVAGNDEKGNQNEKLKNVKNWPRKLIFSQPYYFENENDKKLVTVSSIGESPDEESNDFIRKGKCIIKNGKTGLIEGLLSGIFLGGGLGILKNANLFGNYKKNDGKKKQRSDTDNDDESNVNDNIIFATACNGAVILGVFCTIVSTLRGAMLCN